MQYNNINMEKTIKPESKRKLADGTYDNKPSDPDYFNKYYHTKGSTLTTFFGCGCQCRKNYLSKHTKTQKCKNEVIKRLQHLINNNTMRDFDF